LKNTKSNQTDFTGANLRGADINGSDLFQANFSGADLSDADLSETCFEGANLSNAILRCANASDTFFIRAIFSNTVMPDGSVK
jgi:uncharacterized protein YjbI with pentapeptide repeats